MWAVRYEIYLQAEQNCAWEHSLDSLVSQSHPAPSQVCKAAQDTGPLCSSVSSAGKWVKYLPNRIITGPEELNL